MGITPSRIHCSTSADEPAIHRVSAVCLGFSGRSCTSMPSISSAMVVERADEAVRCFNSRYEVLLEPDAYRLNRQACVLVSSEENEHRTNERTRSRTDRLTNRRLERASEHDCSRNERTNERTKKRLNRAGIRRSPAPCKEAPTAGRGQALWHLPPTLTNTT